MKYVLVPITAVLYTATIGLLYLAELTGQKVITGELHSLSLFLESLRLSDMYTLLAEVYLVTLPLLAILFVAALVKKPWLKNGIIVMLVFIFVLVYHIEFLLSLYAIVKSYRFDFHYFWYNRTVALTTINNTFKGLTQVLLVSITGLGIIFSLFATIQLTKYRPSRKVMIVLLGVSVLSVGTHFLNTNKQAGGIIQVAYGSVRYHSKAQDVYYENFYNYLENEHNNTENANDADTAMLGDTIFMVQLESLSSNKVGSTLTPQLINIADQGILFPKFYSNAVQTIRAQENILCNLPPELGDTLINEFSVENIQDFHCLARSLKNLGYTTLFFQADKNLGFADTDTFMKAIGFDEVHAEDIMKDDDLYLDWGYRDDIFYKRVLEYVQKRPEEKIFAYIAVLATTHAVRAEEHDYSHVPYPSPANERESHANLVFLQDSYLSSFMDTYNEQFADNASLMILSDNGDGRRDQVRAFHNEYGNFEENFLIPFVFVPPRHQES